MCTWQPISSDNPLTQVGMVLQQILKRKIQAISQRLQNLKSKIQFENPNSKIRKHKSQSMDLELDLRL